MLETKLIKYNQNVTVLISTQAKVMAHIKSLKIF